MNSSAVGREMTSLGAACLMAKNFFVRLRRLLPYLVWYEDELDVRVTFSGERLNRSVTSGSIADALFKSDLAKIERMFGEMEIWFDRGVGIEGRDWEWDWSLNGPISVTFKARATKPMRRMKRLSFATHPAQNMESR